MKLLFDFRKLTVRICFVCLGNICRSPAAEAIFKSLAEKEGMQCEVDSAGTSGYHDGEPADSRMIEFGQKRGYNLTSLSRPLKKTDASRFDLFITMDHENYKNALNILGNSHQDKVKKMCDFLTTTTNYSEIPDPYFGGAAGFELVYDLLEEACVGLLENLKDGV
jgi:protein-tyrosine phosphatase